MSQGGCKDCTDRHVGCHSECETYKMYRSELDKQNAERAARKAKQRDWREYKVASYKKNGTIIGAV